MITPDKFHVLESGQRQATSQSQHIKVGANDFQP